MRLASMKSSESLDGILCLVCNEGKRVIRADHIAPSVREALEAWGEVEPELQSLQAELNLGRTRDVEFPFDTNLFHSAIPRTWLFADGSAFIYHVKLVRKARNAPLPETLTTVPLMYQGESGMFLSSNEPIPQIDFSHGTDFEGEVGVLTDFVPMGISAEDALKHIKLIVLINDVSLRGLIPNELASGFGFFQSKPASALSPFAITPDELGENWKNGRVNLPLIVKLNGKQFGCANAGEMHFHFGELISHAAKTRNLAAGTLIGSGTVSNEDHSKGSSCLAEKRMIEQIELNKISTEFLKVGDHVEIEMFSKNGISLFGKINQVVKAVQ